MKYIRGQANFLLLEYFINILSIRLNYFIIQVQVVQAHSIILMLIKLTVLELNWNLEKDWILLMCLKTLFFKLISPISTIVLPKMMRISTDLCRDKAHM